jgi:hypothetical protein
MGDFKKLQMRKFLFYFITLSLTSCFNNQKISDGKKAKANSDKDTIFTRSILNIKSSEKDREEIELYVSSKSDTIFNQHKMFIDNKIDSSRSCFYDLKIVPTNKKNVYKASIKFNSDFKMKTLDKSHRMRLWLSFREETKDSTFFSNIEVNNRNTIDFHYTNIKNDGIQALIIQNVEIDTIIKKEEKVQMRERKLLVDNLNPTLNFSLEPFGFYEDNKFKIDGKRIKKNHP